MTKPPVNLIFSSALPQWDPIIVLYQQEMIDLTQEIISKEIVNPGPAELSLAFIDDEEMAELNHKFRGKNKPTNVLSFTSDPLSQYKNQKEFVRPHLLGDIIFSYGVICQEAEQQGKSLHHHLMHLFVHGLLHLLDYDHQTEEDAIKMEALEVLYLEKRSIPNPYE